MKTMRFSTFLDGLKHLDASLTLGGCFEPSKHNRGWRGGFERALDAAAIEVGRPTAETDADREEEAGHAEPEPPPAAPL